MPSNNNNKSSSSNPNPRNLEITNPMRRSFSSNPFPKSPLITNPRSSSDFPRRSFVDDKENVKDQILKPAKVRSPAANSKTTKNFMSPTISASFKIAESPKKKILAERNEPEPCSEPNIRKVTFADPLEQTRLDASIDGSVPFPSFDDSSEYVSETLSDSNVVPLMDDDLLNETMHMNEPLISHNDIHTETSFENVSQEHDFVNLDPTFKLSPAVATPPVSNTATVIEPLDADPSMPPYDPKTNYLSPRPQFLHYKPKPRMEVCSQREWEDSLMSASLSDTEVTEDSQSDESQKESEDVSSDEIVKQDESQKESEDVSSDEIVNQDDSQKESEDVSSDEVVKQEEDQISEQIPARTLLPEETVEAKELRKPRFSLTSKSVALILLLSIAFVSISITNSPRIDNAVIEDLYETYKLSEYLELAKANFDQFSQFAKANFDDLAQNIHIWFTKSLSSISELIPHVRRTSNLSQFQYVNLTVLQEHIVVDQYPIFGHGKNGIGNTHPVQEKYAVSDIALDEYFGDISAEHYEVYEQQLQHDNALDAPESEEMHKVQPATTTATIESEEQYLQLAEVENFDAKLAQEADASVDVDDAVKEVYEKLDEKSVQEVELQSDEVFGGQSVTLVEPVQILQLVESAVEEDQTSSEDGSECKSSSNMEDAEIHNEVCGEGNVETGLAQENEVKLNNKETDADLKHSSGSNSEVAEIHTDDKAVGNVESTDAAKRGIEQLLEVTSIPPHIVQYLLLCAGTVLIAGATFNWSRKVKSRTKKITSSVKKREIGSENKHISPDKQPSVRNGPVERDVVGEEACASEMSNFDNSSSYKVNQSNEAISLEKKRRNNHRRESFASSSDYSMGSPSYGSLTVYETIVKGRGEEEIVTPVRRSSRIRSLATSPV